MADLSFQQFVDDLLIKVGNLEQTLSIKSGFFNSLLKEGDDWSFTIKTHTLIETALAHLLNESLNRKELEPLIESFSLDGGRTSKIGFIKALKLLDKHHIDFIKELTSLRNKASHNIQATTETLIDQVEGMPEANLNHLLMFPAEEDRNPLLDMARNQPRMTIWLAGLNLLAFIYNKKQEIVKNRFPPGLLGMGGLHQVNLAKALYGYKGPGLLD